jgi:hypothetical protein
MTEIEKRIYKETIKDLIKSYHAAFTLSHKQTLFDHITTLQLLYNDSRPAIHNYSGNNKDYSCILDLLWNKCYNGEYNNVDPVELFDLTVKSKESYPKFKNDEWFNAMKESCFMYVKKRVPIAKRKDVKKNIDLYFENQNLLVPLRIHIDKLYPYNEINS